MSYFVDPNWIGLNGEPITGKIPPRLRMMQGRLTPPLLSEVSHRYHLFCMRRTTSRAQYLVSDELLADGSRVRMVSNGPLEDVLVWAVASSEAQESNAAALAYPVLPLPAYAPIFDRYVFDRSYTPPPPLPYPPEPIFESTIPPPETGGFTAEYTVTYTSSIQYTSDTAYTVTSTTTANFLGAVYVYTSTESWDFGTFLGGSQLGTLLVVKNEPAGQPEDVWPRVLSDAEVWIYTSGAGFEVQLIPELEALKDAWRTAAENAYIQYQAAVAAEYAAWQASTYSQWVAACAAVDQANADRVTSVDAIAESLALRRAGRAAQISAYNSWLDGGINDRHLTWAFFDAPAMTSSKPVTPVDFTGGSGPLESSGVANGGYFATYSLTNANRETVLGDGDSGGVQA